MGASSAPKTQPAAGTARRSSAVHRLVRSRTASAVHRPPIDRSASHKDRWTVSGIDSVDSTEDFSRQGTPDEDSPDESSADWRKTKSDEEAKGKVGRTWRMRPTSLRGRYQSRVISRKSVGSNWDQCGSEEHACETYQVKKGRIPHIASSPPAPDTWESGSD